jgi:hypothetical protein
MKAYRGVQVHLHTFLISSHDEGSIQHTDRWLFPKKVHTVPSEEEAR